MVEKSIIKEVERYLRTVKETGISVRFGVIFGSRVTGGAEDESDIDLIVVAPDFDGKRDRKKMGRLWYVASETDYRIEPIPCGEKQWVEDESTPIIEAARQNGQMVAVPE